MLAMGIHSRQCFLPAKTQQTPWKTCRQLGGMCKHMEGINCIWEAVPSSVQAGLTLGRVVGYIFNKMTAAQPSLEALK